MLSCSEMSHVLYQFCDLFSDRKKKSLKMCYEFRLLFFIFFRKKSKILKCLGVLNCKLFLNTLFPPSFTLCDSNSFSETHKHFSPFLSSGSIHNHQTVILSKVIFWCPCVVFWCSHVIFWHEESWTLSQCCSLHQFD